MNFPHFVVNIFYCLDLQTYFARCSINRNNLLYVKVIEISENTKLHKNNSSSHSRSAGILEVPTSVGIIQGFAKLWSAVTTSQSFE